KTELASTSQPRRFRRISRTGLEHRGDVNLAPGAFHQANDFVLWQLEPGRFVVGRHRHRVVDPDCSGRRLQGWLSDVRVLAISAMRLERLSGGDPPPSPFVLVEQGGKP